jgi:glycogen(starch) synthase
VYHRRCLTVPDALGWRVNPRLILLQQQRWLHARVEAFRPDAVLVHYLHASAPLAREAAREADVPLWIDENETIGGMSSEGQQKLRDWILVELAHADVIVAQCSVQVDELRQLLTHGNIHTIPLGVAQEAAAAEASDPPPLQLICVSRLDLAGKNVDRLLQALALLRKRHAPAVRLTIAGSGFLRPRLERLARELGIVENVTFAGWLSPPVLRRTMRRMHAAVQPSEHESFGLVALEAAAAGLPLVACARAGVVPDLAAAGAAVLPVDTAAPEALASAIEELQIRYSELQRQALEARGRLLERYSWEAHARGYASLLRALRRK